MTWKDYIKLPEFFRISGKEVDEFLSVFDWDNGITLDVGCGYKNVTRSIQNLGGKVITLDMEKSFKPDIIADAKSLPFKNKSIDFLISDGLLEHFDDDDVLKILKEEDRVYRRRVINMMPKNVWWNRILEWVQRTPNVFWRDKVEWNIVFCFVFRACVIGTRSMKRLYAFAIAPMENLHARQTRHAQTEEETKDEGEEKAGNLSVLWEDN